MTTDALLEEMHASSSSSREWMLALGELQKRAKRAEGQGAIRLALADMIEATHKLSRELAEQAAHVFIADGFDAGLVFLNEHKP
jgi:hypothetical protein